MTALEPIRVQIVFDNGDSFDFSLFSGLQAMLVSQLKAMLKLAPVHIAFLRGNRRCFQFLLTKNPVVMGRLPDPDPAAESPGRSTVERDLDLSRFFDVAVKLANSLPTPPPKILKRDLLAGTARDIGRGRST